MPPRWGVGTNGSERHSVTSGWDKVVRIRAYIERAREAKFVYLSQDTKIETLDQWLDWASRYATSIDPFRTRSEEGADGAP